MKSMKISEYFKVVHPKYVILQVIPDTSIRNYNSSNIAGAIARMYKGIFERIKKIEKQYVVETPCKVAFFIDIRKTSVNFYFIVPEQYERLAREKIIETWPKATIEVVESIQQFSDKALKYQLRYTKEDALSLNVDKRNNEPLNNILSVIDVMEEGDRVGIFYNFIPVSQRGWRKEYETTIQKIKNNEPIDKNKFDKVYIIKVTIITLLQILQDIISAVMEVFGDEKKQNLGVFEAAITSLIIDDKKKLSNATIKKKDNTVVATQMIILSESENNNRKVNNAVAVLEAYKTISEDNELHYERLNSNLVYTDYKVKGADENKLSIDECQNLIQLPGRELLYKYDCIRKIETLEIDIPAELRQGTKLIGIATYKGIQQAAYFTTDKDYKNLAIVYIGPTRSGKTTALANYCRDSINAGESIVVLDYIENCSLSESIKQYVRKDKIIEIDLGQFNKIEGFGYNELDIPTNDVLEQYNNAKLKTNQLEYLINSINDENSEFTARMEKYLDAAAIVGFINSGKVKDVFDILENHEKRHYFIRKTPQVYKQYVDDYINALFELDEINKAGEIVGTKMSLITGILSRVNKLKKNTVMELMLKKDTKYNINLVKELQKGKAIFIKMPEDKFNTSEERDIITTYWLTKIWLALQIRASKIPNRYDRTTVNIITDELNQLSSAQMFVGNKLDQCAKFGGKFIISTMYINQLKIREKLRTANTSYIIISGADKTNFYELKEELTSFGFTLEDMMRMQRYHSLNLIKYEKGYVAFISKLPPPLK
ncbi:MAG: hypothetical protein N2486_02185 [Caloramator sp.]|nr:hypothetical protein [Caloramator sp.]